MKKICVFIGSRANWGRLKKVCEEINNHELLELQLIVGASGLWCDIECPHERIECLLNSDTKQGMVLTTSNLMMQIGGYFERLKPDVVLLHGDRYEVLAVATAAAYMGIPLAHTEGGEETGCIDDKVRNSITTMADIHFPVTENSRVKLEDMHSKNIYTVGSTALDNIKHLKGKRNPGNYIVVLFHPNTTKDENVDELIEACNHFDNPKIWVNPNIDAGHMELLKKMHNTKWRFMKNLSPGEYAELIVNSACLVGNSSSFIKEGSFLGVPAVLVGDRQKNRETDSNVFRTDLERNNIIYAIHRQIDIDLKPSCYFGDGTACKKIVEVLACY